MKKVRLIERVPEEEPKVDYTRRVDIDKRIAPESVTCFQDIWMAENDSIASRKTYFIAQKAPCKEIKADSFLNKECFILPPVNYTCFYGSTGMESVETVINGGVLNSTPTHKLTINGTTWYRYLETPAEVSRIHVSKVTDTSTLKWCIKVDNPQEFFDAISTEDFITDRADEESLTVLSEHADNGTPFTLCLVNNQSYEEGILHTSTVTTPETEGEIEQAGNALLNIGIPYFLLTRDERGRLINYTSDLVHFADVVLTNGERCPLSLKGTYGNNSYILVFSEQRESFYKMLRYGFTCVKAGDEMVRCKAFILKKAYEEEMNASRFRIPSKEKVYEITPITNSQEEDELDVLTSSAERYVWSDAILRRPKTEQDEIAFSTEEQVKTFSLIEGGKLDRFGYPDERIQEQFGSYTSTMSSIELKLVSKYVGSYNYVQNSSLNGMDEDHIEERTWYKVYRTNKPTSKDWIKAVQFLENTLENTSEV